MSKQRLIELITMPYEQYLKTQEWLAIRDKILERDGHRCRACNSGEELNVHHRTYARRGHEDLNDLTTFCHSCHEYFHEKISQIDIMERTKARITIDPDADRKANIQKWEEYLIGLLIQNPELQPQVNVYLHDVDFTGIDTRMLYTSLQSAYQHDPFPAYPPFESFVPIELMSTVARAIGIVASRPSVEGGLLSKDAAQCSIKIKQMGLLEEAKELAAQLVTTDPGDTETYQQLRQKLVVNQQRLRSINSIKRGAAI